MSKGTGNFLTLTDAVDKFSADGKFFYSSHLTVTLLDELGGIKDGLWSMNSVVHVYTSMYVLNLHGSL